jgi:Glycosyltransferase 61
LLRRRHHQDVRISSGSKTIQYVNYTAKLYGRLEQQFVPKQGDIMATSRDNADLGDPLPTVKVAEQYQGHLLSSRYPTPDAVVGSSDYLSGQSGTCGRYQKLHDPVSYQLILPASIDSLVHWKFRQGASGTVPEQFLAVIPWGRVYGQGIVITPTNYLLRDLSPQFYHRWDSHALLDQGDMPSPVFLDKNVAVLSSIGSANYYHWMLESLPRIGMIDHQEIDLYYVNIFEPRAGFQEQSLSLLGVPPHKLLFAGPDTHILARKVYAPSPPGKLNFPSGYSCHFLRQLLGSEFLAPSGPERLYLSRDKASRRRVLNEEEVWPWMQQRGFERVELSENPTLREQIGLFSHARIIVGPFGAGFSNIVFSPPGARVVEFFSPLCVRPNYWALANACNHHYGYLLGEGSRPPEFTDPDAGNADIIVDVAKLTLLFEKMGI